MSVLPGQVDPEAPAPKSKYERLENRIGASLRHVFLGMVEAQCLLEAELEGLLRDMGMSTQATRAGSNGSSSGSKQASPEAGESPS